MRGLPVRAAPRIPRLVSASWVFGKRPGLTELGASLALFFLRVWSCPSSVASCGLPVWAAQAWMGVGARSPGSGSAWALCIFRCPTLSAGALRTSPTSYGRREVNPSGRGGNRLDILRRAGQIIRHHYGSRRIMGSRRRRPTPRVSPPRPPDHSVAPPEGWRYLQKPTGNKTVFCNVVVWLSAAPPANTWEGDVGVRRRQSSPAILRHMAGG